MVLLFFNSFDELSIKLKRKIYFNPKLTAGKFFVKSKVPLQTLFPVLYQYENQRRSLMKIIKQIGIIMGICWISLIIEHFLPFAFPASVIGMLLLLLCLMTGVLKLSHIREKSDFLLGNMAFFFLPAGVSMMNYLDILKNNLLPITVICVVSTILTFAATALSIRLTAVLMKRRKHHD